MNLDLFLAQHRLKIISSMYRENKLLLHSSKVDPDKVLTYYTGYFCLHIWKSQEHSINIWKKSDKYYVFGHSPSLGPTLPIVPLFTSIIWPMFVPWFNFWCAPNPYILRLACSHSFQVSSLSTDGVHPRAGGCDCCQGDHLCRSPAEPASCWTATIHHCGFSSEIQLRHWGAGSGVTSRSCHGPSTPDSEAVTVGQGLWRIWWQVHQQVVLFVYASTWGHQAPDLALHPSVHVPSVQVDGSSAWESCPVQAQNLANKEVGDWRWSKGQWHLELHFADGCGEASYPGSMCQPWG